MVNPSFVDGEWQDGSIRGVNFLAGFRGMGKTTEMGRLMNECRGTVVFSDFTGNHPRLLRGAVTVYQPGELKEWLLARRTSMRIRYVPMTGDHVEHFRALCAVCAAFGQIILAVDEIDNYCGPDWKRYRMPPELYELAHMGRHHQTSMIFTARDPTTISINLRSQCETIRIFRTVEETYVKYFRPRIGAAMATRLYTLPPYQYVMAGAAIPRPGIYKAGKPVSQKEIFQR